MGIFPTSKQQRVMTAHARANFKRALSQLIHVHRRLDQRGNSARSMFIYFFVRKAAIAFYTVRLFSRLFPGVTPAADASPRDRFLKVKRSALSFQRKRTTLSFRNNLRRAFILRVSRSATSPLKKPRKLSGKEQPFPPRVRPSASLMKCPKRERLKRRERRVRTDFPAGVSRCA